MISNSQWDWYCLWKKTYEVTQRSGTEHTVIPQPWPCSHHVVLLWVRAQTPSKGAGVASTAGADPCPCSATLFHPRVSQWGLKQKLFCPDCSQQSSCYRLQQLSAVRAAFTLAEMMLGALSASGCPVVRAGHYKFLLLLPVWAQHCWCLVW